jgi:hypothetical protein
MTSARANVKGSDRMQEGPQRRSCGPFAVPSAGNSREQARTADREPHCFRGFSCVFPPVLGQRTYRGVRVVLAFLCGFRGLCGPFAVLIPRRCHRAHVNVGRPPSRANQAERGGLTHQGSRRQGRRSAARRPSMDESQRAWCRRAFVIGSVSARRGWANDDRSGFRVLHPAELAPAKGVTDEVGKRERVMYCSAGGYMVDEFHAGEDREREVAGDRRRSHDRESPAPMVGVRTAISSSVRGSPARPVEPQLATIS